ncbi:MAG: NTP transferase domain-containing protein [Rhizobiaceae bacterium]|nr:NTP transferase domain-containing protein [Rhizobiaceae bacterium]
MRFGAIPLGEAEGAILAHAIRFDGGRLAKGSRLAAADIAALRDSGIAEVVAAVLDADDLSEDDAAERIGAAIAGRLVSAGPTGTGRVNLFAEAAGLFVPDRAVVDRLNAIDPGITLATLSAYEPVEAGRMVATVKIIPLAVPEAAVREAVSLLAATPAFRVAPYRGRRVALIQTELPGIKSSVLDKTRTSLQKRLDASGSAIVSETRCAHQTAALAAAIVGQGPADLTVVFGASAVIDARDVIPSAVEDAGGTVTHLGMPVDPGNLLLLGEIAGTPIIGAPGCARSPKENGFDWILNRLLADLPVTGDDIRGMGVGGLLMEIATRPQPRATVVAKRRSAPATPSRPVVDIVILAAGRSSRMGGPNKLLATFDGVPLLRRSALTALGSSARRVRVVVGHRADEMEAVLAGLDVEITRNADFVDGLSTSLIAGFRAGAEGAGAAEGVLVMLADQPFLRPADVDRLISAFVREGAGSIVVATSGGVYGNPVVLSAGYREEVLALSGDVGARAILAAHRQHVVEIEIGDAAAIDVDTPEALAAAGGRFEIEGTLPD